MKVKMILPALTEAVSPFWRPIKYSLFPPLGLATLAGYLDPDDEVVIEDEHVEKLNLDDEPDLVVIQVYITSAYRAPRYNREIPGASRHSYHTRNQALDLIFACPASEAIAMARRLRNERFVRGGIGVYPTFVHVDTRGYNANWRG